MKKLSKYQQEVLDKMKPGVYLWTNEGKNFSCWLGDSNGEKYESVNRATVQALYKHGELEFLDGDYRHDWVRYNKKGQIPVFKCDECAGGGFSTAGTGYNNVCDKCSGLGMYAL